ncbi:hypothetical protein BD626DRAFT_424541 [Schizophyllum amplum]|uniref:Uncharacterized protein n=1 Tax=Schizophyllum amplum TaxID=97359 RepID=A0A550CT78_9AGAR|nr:hypothetical protein BD626DRAFT_424541 [Auriculariopsis ampla]
MGSHKLAQSHAPANTHAPTNRIPEPFEVLRAIERRDEMYLMDVRDRAFPLLLSTKAGDPPLLHALRIGASHRSIALLLVGAFSRYINNLEEQEMAKQGVRGVLKALRTNLKLAIDHDLAAERSDLAASFMQVLVMSEGERWVSAQAEAVGRELRVGVDRSGEGRRFATRELGRAELIASLEDYIGNATVDLLLLGAWGLAREVVGGEGISTSSFARDDRVYRAFCERLDGIGLSERERLRWQLRVLRAAVGGRRTTYRRKVELLEAELDDG